MMGVIRAALTHLRHAGAPSSAAAGSLCNARVWKSPPPADDSAVIESAPSVSCSVDPDLVPILGEFAWHSLTLDSRLAEVSEEHYAVVSRILADVGRPLQRLRVLEIAAYAHTTGYMLHGRLGARTDLLDISPSTLSLGRRMARAQGLPIEGTRCVAADFHDLPYADSQFDVVYICSSLHHTWRWQRVLGEMVRVLAPGGILLLENEPCRRRFCHYRFRANRVERYGELEHALDRLGILRTIAEPFPNTRPETLFGMVENQTIPIASLCGMLAMNCAPLAMTADYGPCLGPFESELLAHRTEGTADCKRWLLAEMTRRVEEASVAVSASDRGMGFGLPSLDEIAKLCSSTVDALVKLPADVESPDFRIGLADIFGASVRIAVRKRGRRRDVPRAGLSRQYAMRDDIVLAFPPRIARLLDAQNALLPDIQSSPIAALGAVFPSSDWTIDETQDGLRWLTSKSLRPRFTVPVSASGPHLVLVRLYVAVDVQPFRVALCHKGTEVAGFDAYQSDSLLLTPTVYCSEGESKMHLSFNTQPLGTSVTADSPALFTVSYAGAFPL
ncbi:MAG: class I SAM-dependent methyltransferase [Betaproteobacteria bacterium]|nr:MAG: class I SAM-dependent methyltransferase [Betaproteobacteria bacterium]